MKQTYLAYCNGSRAGEVEVEQCGLYYRFVCRSRLPEGRIYRLYAGTTCLGVLVPECGVFKLQTRRSVRQIAVLPGSFQIHPDGQETVFVPLGEDTAGDCLSRLEQARFCVRDGIPGLIFPLEK